MVWTPEFRWQLLPRMNWRCTADVALGGNTEHQTFQDATHVVSVAGQRLKFAPCEALCDPRRTKFHITNTQVCCLPKALAPTPHPSPMAFPRRVQHGISVVATCPKTLQYAFAERRLRPVISVCSFADMQQVCALEGALADLFAAKGTPHS